ncbi:MAG: 50S ribosomal protein L36 [bacterium]|nr:50S ribosomal protein L36 [bacterium]
MKVCTSVSTICEHCQIIRRSGKGGNQGKRVRRVLVRCKRNRRHNRRQG